MTDESQRTKAEAELSDHPARGYDHRQPREAGDHAHVVGAMTPMARPSTIPRSGRTPSRRPAQAIQKEGRRVIAMGAVDNVTLSDAAACEKSPAAARRIAAPLPPEADDRPGPLGAKREVGQDQSHRPRTTTTLELPDRSKAGARTPSPRRV